MAATGSALGARTVRTPPAVSAVPARTAPVGRVPSAADTLDYARDVCERWVLFWDTLRQRADDMIEHERAGKPPLLDFDYETLLDARHFDRPVNYALLRITRIGDSRCEECVDAANRPPVIVLDPRAGHGPGIGGFKRDSEIGMAMREGHPVYFVTFFPEPCAGQTLADVLHALRRFVEHVAARHPGKPPVLYGNCQAGWAVALLAADCQGLSGPAVLNGSPLSYWAGEPGINPMRTAAGFTGGAWLVHWLADLGDGRFDGAWLVANFENLKPEAVWDKYAGLFTDVDAERDRFLQFERWWSGFYLLSREEILAIVENLFIGDRVEQGTFRVCECCYADLRQVRNPLVIFASWGDNITPPHQALGWIAAVYRNTAELKAAGQRIVYLTNPHVGHLGIFVSAQVARLEHRAILESLKQVEELEPGLYEMRIDNPSGDADARRPSYSVHFEPREVSDLKFSRAPDEFRQVRAWSEFHETLYRECFSPWVRALANPWSSELMQRLHPMRTSRYGLSARFLPWMAWLEPWARELRQQRTALAPEHPWLSAERAAMRQVSEVIRTWRVARDTLQERSFAALFAPTGTPASATAAKAAAPVRRTRRAAPRTR